MDELFAQLMAERCSFVLRVLSPTLKDLIEVMPDEMRVLHTFDPMDFFAPRITKVHQLQ